MKKHFSVIIFILSLILFSSCQKNSTSSASSGTCSDGILNQDETAIDCGGKCSKCVTCSDGIQNQGETGIDCGGPCANTCPIKYPEFGANGRNLLYVDTTTKLISNEQSSVSYCLKCELPQGTRLKVVLKNLDASGYWQYLPGASWQVTPWNGLTQTFSTVGPVIAEVPVYFRKTGAVEISIYENNDTIPLHVKGYEWH